MGRIDVNNMSREEKIQLIENIENGEIRIVNGEIVSLEFAGGIFFDKEGRYYLDQEKTIEVDEKYITEKAEASEENGVIFFPIRTIGYEDKKTGNKS